MKLKKCPMCKMMVPAKVEVCPVCSTEYSKFQYFIINHLTKCILIILAAIMIYNSVVIILFNRKIRDYIDNPPEDIKVVENIKKEYKSLNFIQKYFVRESEIELVENSVINKDKLELVEDYTCKVTFGDGSRWGVYTGELYENQPDGSGVFSYYLDDGTFCTYDGEFKKGRMDGFGVMTFEDGGKYVGQFISGEIDGYASVYNPDGYMVKKGNFVSGKLNGIAAIYDDYGQEIYEGRFISDIPTESEYTASCIDVTFAELERDTQRYVNKNLKIKGVVTEIAIQEDMTVLYVMNIAGNRHKNICIEYIGNHGVNIRQGDNLTFYGYCSGYRQFVSSAGEIHGGMMIKTYYAK